MRQNNQTLRPWVRGVNLGGWLLLERFITPYFFALTDCHIRGDFRFYPNQINAPPVTSPLYKAMDREECTPLKEYPVEEWTLTSSFPNKDLARKYMKIHWDNFVTRSDIEKLARQGGVTYLRVPLGHWIMGDILEEEPWVDGGWMYFKRLVEWCREEGLQVWPDVHTAPGSQNGFDNSGLLLEKPTCDGWDVDTDIIKEINNESTSTIFFLTKNMKRSLKAVQDITEAIARDNMTDIVTGFGVLNEPFPDCDINLIRQFNNQALNIVRANIGEGTTVYIGDLFNASKWNDGWWIDEQKYHDTILDSHFYHIFAERPRHLSPRQHIGLVCQRNHRDTVACCYEDQDKKIPAKGISRLIGEWSASFDTLVCDKLDVVMDGIAVNGKAPEFDRQIGKERQAFLRNFVEAQMVTYEAADVGVSRGWFYWTFKTEGGAFAEWNFLRGIEEGWIPPIPPTNISSENLYGKCYDILFRTVDDYRIIHEFPDASSLDLNNWQGIEINDDVVLSHGQSLVKDGSEKSDRSLKSNYFDARACFYLTTLFIGCSVLASFCTGGRRRDYTEINADGGSQQD